MNELAHFSANTITGETCSLQDFAGKVLLIVNVASRCGFTPQYAGLEKLYQTYKEQGFSVLAFPCNQFGGQEPGSAEDIQAFCAGNYQVSFPLFEKITVNGPKTHPLYKYLKKSVPGVLGIQTIKWNFTKFLLDRNGKVVQRFAPAKPPEALAGWIEKLL